MPLVRDTINPLNEREVSDEEALDLDRMGILLKSRAKRPETLRAAATRQVIEQLEGTASPAVTSAASPTVEIGVGDPDDAPDDDQDDQDPGDPPASTTDDTLTDSQES